MSLFRKQSLRKIKDIPQSSVGAPCPLVFSTEHSLGLTYYLQDTPSDWGGDSVKMISEDSTDEPSVIVTFTRVLAHYSGSPNDEAIAGHPLYSHGLRPYSYYEVINSKWIEELKERNKVHPYHSDSIFSDYRHFIFTFHDTTVEVVAKNYSFELSSNSLVTNTQHLLNQLV